MNRRLSKIHIKSFIKNNNIDMSQYEESEYSCFNDCFTRKIKEGMRPVSLGADEFISPADSRLTVYEISEKSDFFIKGSYYTVKDLLGGSSLADKYIGGKCLVFRLCVDDYHRYGYVDNGNIVENRYIKGRLHTVRPIALNRYPVFIQNSREYTVIETENFGTVTQIEVGAMMIGRIKNHQTEGKVVKGAEKGMFLYGGSTVVVLVEKDVVEIDPIYIENTNKDIETKVKYGSTIGKKRV